MLATLSLVAAIATPQLPPDFPTATVIADAFDGEFRGHGDFDGDGDVDLIHFTSPSLGWTAFSLFLNDGLGGLTRTTPVPFAFPANYTIGTMQPRVGDFDGDGNLDFVIARDGPGAATGEGLEFFLGDGAGGFGVRRLLPLSNPGWLREGSIDADAALEVAVRYSGPNLVRQLAWVDFQGGLPVLGTPLPMTPGVTPDVFVFETVDVDGDGLDDVAATARTALLVDQVVFFPTVGGAPTLGAQFFIPAAMQNVNHRLLAGDLDGDGDRDLLLVKMEPFDPGPWVQAFERTALGWTQRVPESVPTPATGWLQPHYTYLTDWDGDGWLDLVAAGDRTDVVRSDADWTFSEGFEAGASGQREGGGPCDVDGDGRIDFVAGQTILFGDGSFVMSPLEVLPFTTDLVFDRERDGDLDLTSWIAGHFASNDAAGAFAATPPGTSLFPSPAPYVYDAPIAYADFDGDGRSEFLVMFGQQVLPVPFVTGVGMHRIAEDGTGGYLPGVLATNVGNLIDPPSFADPHWATGDVDGDGDVDLLVEGGYRQNDGTGGLDVFVPAYTGRGRAVADVDGDGYNDVVVTQFAGGMTQLSVYYGTTTGLSATWLAVADGDLDADLRDLDGDGDLDLLAAADFVRGLLLFENVGGAFVAGATALPQVDASDLRHVGVDDYDGDGVPDLLVKRELVGATVGATATLARYRGAGSNLAFQLAAEQLCPFGIAGFADFDSDGDLDAFGSVLLRSSLIPAGAGGAIRQYGEGVAGSGGFVPTLGARGPVRSTSFDDELRLVGGLGGSPSLLAFGLVESAIPNVPLPGLVLYVGDPLVLVPPPLTGAAGAVGQGTLTLTLPNLPIIAGVTFVHQAFVLDPGSAGGWSASNGLAITYGQ